MEKLLKCDVRFTHKLKSKISFWFQCWIFFLKNMLVSHARGESGG